MDNSYTVYVKVDVANRITEITSSAFISDTAGWVQIDEGVEDKYHHAQGNYLPQSIITETGVYRYKLAGGAPAARTAAELAADAPAAGSTPGTAARIEALEAAVLVLMEESV